MTPKYTRSVKLERNTYRDRTQHRAAMCQGASTGKTCSRTLTGLTASRAIRKTTAKMASWVLAKSSWDIIRLLMVESSAMVAGGRAGGGGGGPGCAEGQRRKMDPGRGREGG